MYRKSASFTDKAFFGNKQNFRSWDSSPLKRRIIRISELPGAGLKEFCCATKEKGESTILHSNFNKAKRKDPTKKQKRGRGSGE
jgi:hypothetical protein